MDADGKPDGIGRVICLDGKVFEGQLNGAGLLNGFVKNIDSNGDGYVGWWING